MGKKYALSEATIIHGSYEYYYKVGYNGVTRIYHEDGVVFIHYEDKSWQEFQNCKCMLKGVTEEI